jgi:hypothetical protein
MYETLHKTWYVTHNKHYVSNMNEEQKKHTIFYNETKHVARQNNIRVDHAASGSPQNGTL